MNRYKIRTGPRGKVLRVVIARNKRNAARQYRRGAFLMYLSEENRYCTPSGERFWVEREV